MNRKLFNLWFIVLVIVLVPVYVLGDEDEWPIRAGTDYNQINCFISSVEVAVLDGHGLTIASLPRLENNQTTASSTVSSRKPKPRPRLGVGVESAVSGGISKTYLERFEENTRFLQDIANRLTYQWNSPGNISEALNWVHEIEVEGVFIINKQKGTISVETISNSMNSKAMEHAMRFCYHCGDGELAGEERTYITSLSELERFKEFVVSMAPIIVPDYLLNLPGESIRFRILFKVAKSGSEAVSGVSTPGGDKRTLLPASKISAGSFGFGADGDKSIDPLYGKQLHGHLDVRDPVFQHIIALRYFHGDGIEKTILYR